MCFNEPVSWAALIVGWIGCAILYMSSDKQIENKVIALFFAFVVLMQLWEALLWHTAGVNCSNINSLISICAMVSNHLQPIVLLALCAIFLPRPSPHMLALVAVITTIYLALILPYSWMYLLSKNRCSAPRTASFGSMVWKWNSLDKFSDISFAYRIVCYYTFLTLLCILVGVFFTTHKWVLIGLMLVTFMASLFLYQGRLIVGSMWCFFAAGVPWAFILLNAYKNRTANR